jgi:polyisoprenoid-binding protein YceI
MNSKHAPAIAATPGFRAGAWRVDLENSKLGFSVRLMGKKVPGQFTSFDTTIITGENPRHSAVSARIDLASIDTGNPKRDEHLRSAAFLDVAAHPTATYDSTAVKRDGAGWLIEGHLTLHGVTESLPLAITEIQFVAGAANSADDAFSADHASFTATALVNRADFGIARWSGGGLVVSTKVAIKLVVAAVLLP